MSTLIISTATMHVNEGHAIMVMISMRRFNTPLHYAVEQMKTETVKYILKHEVRTYVRIFKNNILTCSIIHLELMPSSVVPKA